MKLVYLLPLLFLFGCTNVDQAQRVLKAEGVTNVTMTGYKFFTCGDDYTFHTGFTGTKNGESVSGAVCSGFLKGAQIKYE